MKYKSILFDLDGTLTDSGPGIRSGVRHALKRFGIEENNLERLNRFIGPPLYDSFMRFYNIPPEEAKKGEMYFREYYSDKGIYENSLYDGVSDTLKRLNDAEKRLYIATSKPEFMARRVAEYFGIDKYFTAICGSFTDGTGSTKKEVIERLFENCPEISAQSVIMVGDRKHDIDGAAACGIPCAAVLWGYGSKEEFEEHGASYIVKTPAELCSLLMS